MEDGYCSMARRPVRETPARPTRDARETIRSSPVSRHPRGQTRQVATLGSSPVSGDRQARAAQRVPEPRRLVDRSTMASNFLYISVRLNITCDIMSMMKIIVYVFTTRVDSDVLRHHFQYAAVLYLLNAESFADSLLAGQESTDRRRCLVRRRRLVNEFGNTTS